jgi:hypothetical protein
MGLGLGQVCWAVMVYGKRGRYLTDSIIFGVLGSCIWFCSTPLSNNVMMLRHDTHSKRAKRSYITIQFDIRS